MDFDKLPWCQITPDPIATLRDLPVYVIGRAGKDGFAYGIIPDQETGFLPLSCYTDYSFWDERGKKSTLCYPGSSLDRVRNPDATHCGIGTLGHHMFVFPNPLPPRLAKNNQIVDHFGSPTTLVAGFFCKSHSEKKKIFLVLILFTPEMIIKSKKKSKPVLKGGSVQQMAQLTVDLLAAHPAPDFHVKSHWQVVPVDITHPDQNQTIAPGQLVLYWNSKHLGVALCHPSERIPKDKPVTYPALESFSPPPGKSDYDNGSAVNRRVLALIDWPIKATTDNNSMFPLSVNWWGNLNL